MSCLICCWETKICWSCLNLNFWFLISCFLRDLTTFFSSRAVLSFWLLGGFFHLWSFTCFFDSNSGLISCWSFSTFVRDDFSRSPDSRFLLRWIMYLDFLGWQRIFLGERRSIAFGSHGGAGAQRKLLEARRLVGWWEEETMRVEWVGALENV